MKTDAFERAGLSGAWKVLLVLVINYWRNYRSLLTAVKGPG